MRWQNANFTEGRHLILMNLHELINKCLLGALKQVMPSVSMFQDGSELYYFPRGIKNYNYMKEIMKLLER